MKSDEAVELLRECRKEILHTRFHHDYEKDIHQCSLCKLLDRTDALLAQSKAAPQDSQGTMKWDIGGGVAPASGYDIYDVGDGMSPMLRPSATPASVTSLTYPPEAASWVAIKGDKPVAVVEKAAYDDLRAMHVALREKREGWIAVDSATDTGECGIPWGTRIVTKQDIDGSRYKFILPLISAAPSAGRGGREKP